MPAGESCFFLLTIKRQTATTRVAFFASKNQVVANIDVADRIEGCLTYQATTRTMRKTTKVKLMDGCRKNLQSFFFIDS